MDSGTSFVVSTTSPPSVGGVPEGCARGGELGAIQVESMGSVSGPALAKDLVIIRAVGVGGRVSGGRWGVGLAAGA